MSIKHAVLVVMLFGGASAVAVPDFPAYSVTDLKALGIWPVAMNQRGQVVGHACCGRQSAGALLYTSGEVRDLGLPPGFSTFRATAINDNGWVVGYDPDPSGLWGTPALHDGVGWTVIDTSSFGTTQGYLTRINNAGQVIGSSSVAWLFDRGALIRLTPLDSSVPTDINETGEIVGYDQIRIPGMQPGEVSRSGWTWRDGQLSAFTGQGAPGLVNDAGTIVTLDYVGRTPTRAYVVEGGVTTPIPFIGCDSVSECRMSPSAINERGDVVGHVTLRPGFQWRPGPDNELESAEIQSAFRYRMGETTALGTLGGELAVAQSLNNRGQVAGWSTDSPARRHPFFVYDLRPFVYDDGVMLDVSDLRGVGAAMYLGNVIFDRNRGSGGLEVAINDGPYVLVIGTDAGITLESAYLLTPVAPTVTVTASPTQAPVRQPVTLAWEAVNANSCVATGGVAGDGWTGTLATSGQLAISEVNPGTVQYGVRCTAGGLSSDAQVSVVFQEEDGGGGRLDLVALLLIGVGLARRRRFQL